jgi:lysozyme
MPQKKKSSAWIWIAFLIFVVALGSGYLVFKFRNQIDRKLSNYTRKVGFATKNWTIFLSMFLI